MKILFLARHFSYLRLFESAIAELAARDPKVTVGWTPARQTGAWADLGKKLRLGIDYLRFLDPRYDHTPRLRGRSEERTPHAVRWLARSPLFRGAGGRRTLGWVLRQFE